MCPCRCLRRCFSCDGGGGFCCPRPCCHGRSRSMDLRNCRVVFPGEYQKFSDMIPPSFLQKDPKSRKKRARSKNNCRSQKGQEDKECKEKSGAADCENEGKSGGNDPCENGQGVPGEPVCPGEQGFSGIPGYPGGPAMPGFPGVPVIPGGPVQETPGGLGAGIWFQPSDLPCCGTFGPDGTPMIFGMPPPNQYGCFGVPGPMGLSGAPPGGVGSGGPQRSNRGIPAAGLPTKRVPQFDPCTGQVFECENQQMGVGNSNHAAQGPSYNQFLQGLNLGFGPLSPYYLHNAGDGPVGMPPEHLDRVREANSSECQGKGKETGEGNLANQQNQYNSYNFVEEGMYPRQVPQQMPSDDCEPQGDNRSKPRRNRSESREDLRSNQHHRSKPGQNPSDGCEPQGGKRSKSQRNRSESREDSRSNQYYRRNTTNFGEGATDPSAVQGVHRSRSQRKRNESREDPRSNQHHRRNTTNFGEGATDPRQVPQQNPSAAQGVHRSRSQRKRNESREDPRSNQHTRYNSPNFREEPKDPRRVPHQNPNAGHESQGGHRSRSQRNRNESREDPRSNQHFREELMDPRRAPHQNPTAGHESQGGHRSRSQRNPNESRGDTTNQHLHFNSPNIIEVPMDPRQDAQQKGNRSKSQGHRNESREDPRSNQRRYTPYPPNFRGEPINPRNPGNQVSQGPSRSKSPEKRNQSSRAATSNKQSQCPSNYGDGTGNPRQVQRSKSSADPGHHGDGRSKSSRKRNESRECPPEKLPQPNLHFYQQSVGMTYGPSNQCYVADCPLPDPIYITQVESTWSESHPGDGRSSSPKRHNEPKEGTSTRRPESSSRKGDSRKEQRSKERNQPPTEGAPLNQPIHNYSLRFEPNNQYYPYYVSNEYDCYPPPAESSRSLRHCKGRHDLASHDCPEPLSRISESCSSDDLQQWSHRLTVPMEKSKKKSASGAKGSRRANGGTKSKSSSAKTTSRKTSAKKVSKQNSKNMDGKSTPKQSTPVAEPQEIPAGHQEESGPEEAKATPAASCKPEMVSCSCYANLPGKSEETTDKDGQKGAADPGAANPAGCPTNSCPTNSCWAPCPSPWSGCCNPCNGYYYYRANCCNGCRNCCNCCCNPCGRYCCSRPPSNSQPKPKEKLAGGGVGKNGMKRYPGGAVAAVSGPGYFCLQPPPELSYPIPRPSTMPGYLPTVPPQFNSPYSGRWQAGGVVSNQRSSVQNPINISCMRH